MVGQFGIFGPGCFTAFLVCRVHLRRAERHDRSRGGYERSGKVGVAFGLALLQPRFASRSGTEERPRRPSWLPGHPGEFDCRGLGNRVRRPLLLIGSGLAGVLRLGSAANLSAFHPTRLETRTKESNMRASHWAVRNPKAQ